jgi:hypothetical protein
MRRSLCGLAVLTALGGMWSCNGDPTESIREGERIIADPTAVFVNQGETKFVTVQLVDGQGNALAADIQSQNVGTGITVEEDATYLATTNGERVPTSTRFIVGGVAATSTAFEAAVGGTTLSIPVRVVPAGAGIPLATVSSTGPNASDPTVLTVPAPFQFFPDSAFVTFDAGQGIAVDLSADGTSLTVLPPPGTTSTGTAYVRADYIPTVPLATTTDLPLTISPTVPAQAGTGSLATAPAIPLSAVGGGLWDAGTFPGTVFGADQYYQFTIAADGDFTINVDWTTALDIDYFLCADVACSDPDFTGATGDHPEIHDFTLVAGTYYLVVNLFTGPAPPWVRVAITPTAQ